MIEKGRQGPVVVSMEDARAIRSELVAIRRELHQHPELGFEVGRSAGLVKRTLESLGVPVRSGVGRSGIVGLIEGAKPGPVVALRADLDALPIQEQNEVSYRSRVNGVMHACGHDLHTACLLGAARLLTAVRETIPGKVKLIFQPAEEIDMGAREMITDGVLDNPRVDAIFGLHNYPGQPTGSIAVSEGPLMAGIDTFRILIEGRGGHGAVPDQAVDALLAAASVVLQLQTVVSRNVSPLKEAVVSIGTFQAGTASNIVADKAELSGTARALDREVRAALSGQIRRVVENGCKALGATGRLEYTEVLPPVINDHGLVDILRRAATRLLGAESVLSADTTMAGDDFALYLEHVPGCYFWLGATDAKTRSHGWHYPRFDVDEGALPIGSAVLAQTALEFLQAMAKEPVR